jgi:hypothetical protein
MANYTGKFLFIFVAAVLLSSAAAWMTARRYRTVMQRLMRAPVTASAIAMPAAATPVATFIATPITLSPPLPVTLAGNRRATVTLALVLIVLSCLMAATSASIYLLLAFPAEPFAPKRAAIVALMHLWPVIPALGLLWRWSLWRVAGALLLWAAVCFPVMLWRSIEPQPMQIVLALAVEIGPPMAAVALLCMGSATRAIAPWLVLPFAGLLWTSIVGTDILASMVERRSPVLMWLIEWLPAHAAIPMFALLPWLIAWWPLRQLGRTLGRAYARKQLSELLVLFTAVWTISLLFPALGVAGSAGLTGAAMFLPLLWIPLVMAPYAHLQVRQGRPPTLLVLRVFQHDAQVQDLFDHVIERWRLSGNTAMIAGTDLAERTIDADDIFTFLDGRLADRFIRTPDEVAPRLAAFDMAPDADGRYRVNECYCHDTTWQAALQALVRQSDVVLMDLRGFQAHNAGCRYELGALAQAPGALRVVVLTDSQTDRAAAADAIGQCHAERFVWLDATRIDACKRREVLDRLFS